MGSPRNATTISRENEDLKSINSGHRIDVKKDNRIVVPDDRTANNTTWLNQSQDPRIKVRVKTARRRNSVSQEKDGIQKQLLS